MICPTCQNSGQRSTVRIVKQPAINKAIFRDVPPTDHFWDEEGNEHSHNPSIIVTEYLCSKGHRFAERSSWECGACGYRACEAEVVANG